MTQNPCYSEKFGILVKFNNYVKLAIELKN